METDEPKEIALCILDELIANGELGPVSLYAWYLDEKEFIYAAMKQMRGEPSDYPYIVVRK